MHRLFADRHAGGVCLAEHLADYRSRHPVVLGIPRGGVPVAAEVARRLAAPLDLVVAHKIGAPGREELAIGAVATNGSLYLDDETIAALDVPPTYVRRAIAHETAAARRREAALRRGRAPIALVGRTVIVVDDGLATGATMRAALRAVRAQQPAAVVAAAPVGASATCAALRAAPDPADDLVCAYEFTEFRAVGLYYEDFSQTTDDEVRCLLETAGAPTEPPGARRAS